MFTKILFVASLFSSSSVLGQVQEWGQCGGIGYTGSTTCVSPYVCTVINAYYYQCLPASSTATTVQTSTTATTTTRTTTSGGSTSTGTGLSGIPRGVGVNFAGWDFGTQIDGSFSGQQYVSPPSNNQLTHFQAERVNLYRIPVGWAAIQPTLGGAFNSTAWTMYQSNVNTALNTGAYVIIDIHNYARWNGGIIGQGGPTNDQFANLWTTIAKVYASNPKVIFGLMNEPHDLTLSTWAQTVQYVVNAIRSAGATKNPILIPGDNWTSGSTFTTWYTTMSTVTDPITANGHSLLLFDHHRYLDSDGSGTGSTCVSNRISEFQANVALLQANNRQAILSETGGTTDASCLTSPGYLPELVAYIDQSYPWYIGVTGWGAGAFTAQNSILNLSPTPNNAVTATDATQWTLGFKPYVP